MVAMLTPSSSKSSSAGTSDEIGLFSNSAPLGYVGTDTNLYRYVSNSPTNATDPSGTITIWQGRELGGELPAIRGRIAPTHEFIATIDNEGTIHTYSWGNDIKDKTNPSHWFKDRDEDIKAVKDAVAKHPAFMGKTVGGSSLDPFVDEAFKQLHDAGAKSPSAHPHGGALGNCKTEAERLLKLAKKLRNEQ